MKGNILETIMAEELHLLKKIHQNSYRKFFDLTKERHMHNFYELISKNKVTLLAKQKKRNGLLICLPDNKAIPYLLQLSSGRLLNV